MANLRLLLAIYIIFKLVAVNAIPIARSPEVTTEFIILHNNDMHARFEQTSKTSGKCTPADANSNKCYGGFARVAYEVRKYREEAKSGGLPVLYLNAGDTYTGTAWFTLFKDNITAAFLNKLQPDAISLGNHEFDENVEGLVPFLNAVDFPVLASNLDVTKVPELAQTKSFKHFTILETAGTKVGVIGYLTPTTKDLTLSNNVEFKPEIESINAEAKTLKASGINIIIALGHSGYQKDQDIAAHCPDVDIVIGGHSHSFLYTGEQTDAERIEGPYPTVVTQSSGKKVPVVQAYAYTKYLGKLHVQFDKDGNLIEFDGTPILLDASIPAEDDVLQLLEVYRPNITALEESVVGHTKVFLEGNSTVCRADECNLGNLVTDSMIYARVLEDLGGQYWTDAAISLIPGGGIRSSIDKRSDGSITESDIFTVLPFDNDVYVAKVTGQNLREALEHSASLRDKDSNGGFLQMSGIRTTYDYNNEEGQRVVSVEVRCSECEVPTYAPLANEKHYNILLPAFTLNGGDGYNFESVTETQRLQKKDKEILMQYLMQREIVYPEVEGRLHIIEKREGNHAPVLGGSITFAFMAVLLVRLFL